MAELSTGVLKNASTAVFRTIRPGPVYLNIHGTIDATPPTIALMWCDTENGTFAAVVADGVAVEYTALGLHKNDLMSYHYRYDVSDTGTNALDFDVQGDFVKAAGE